jgi:hypothetical protein
VSDVLAANFLILTGYSWLLTANSCILLSSYDSEPVAANPRQGFLDFVIQKLRKLMNGVVEAAGPAAQGHLASGFLEKKFAAARRAGSRRFFHFVPLSFLALASDPNHRLDEIFHRRIVIRQNSVLAPGCKLRHVVFIKQRGIEL